MQQPLNLHALVRALIVTAVVSVTAPVFAAAAPIVFASWGGTTQSAQQKDWAAPFTQASGIQVLMDGPTDYGKLKAMVDSGNVQWDVVDVEGDFAYAALRDGLVEPIDYSVVNKSQLDPRFMSPGAVGSFYYSFVLGYNKASFKNGGPANYADLFDTKRFPANVRSTNGPHRVCWKSRCLPTASRPTSCIRLISIARSRSSTPSRARLSGGAAARSRSS